MLWQVLFIVLSTTWLWAPQLNHSLSYRTSLISQYESPSQPYAWLFRLCDGLAAALLIMAGLILRRRSQQKDTLEWSLVLLIGLGMLLDPVFASACRLDQVGCQDYFSLAFVIHASATVFTATGIFLIAIYDSWIRKRVVSMLFSLFQIVYGLLLLSQLATHHNFNTLSQYIYQLVSVLWLAWFVQDRLRASVQSQLKPEQASVIRRVLAAWVFFNGVLAILVSLADLHLIGNLRGLYFASDNAWLAQHGVVIGTMMIYLSRHLARGERRARQIFLAICGIETLKYSLITPHPLLLLYFGTFLVLFILRDEFDRGTMTLTLEKRLREAAFMVISLTAIAATALILIGRNNDQAQVVVQAIDHFFDYAAGSSLVSHVHLKSALLAHTFAAFLLSGGGLILWILFKPIYKKPLGRGVITGRLVDVLSKYSRSSEDYLKVWPPDKQYFWDKNKSGFIAYKVAGGVAFCLADPIAPDDKTRKILLEDFVNMCRERRLRTCFLLVSQSRLRLYSSVTLNTLQIGSSALIIIDKFLSNTIKDKWWRWKINKATKSGYTFLVSQPPHSQRLLRQLKGVSDQWLTKQGRRERSFALGYFDSKYLKKTRLYHLSDSSEQIIAFTNQLPTFKPLRVATIDLLRHVPGANDAIPYLLMKTIEHLGQSGEYKYFDLGFVPFAHAKGPILTIAKALSTGRFSSKGLEQFKNKFDPEWQPNYLAYDGDLADLALIAVNLEKVMKLK